MRRNRIIALLVIVLGIGTLLGQAAFSAKAGKPAKTAAVRAKAKATGAKAQARKSKAGKVGKALKLTPEQKTKIKAILTDAKAKAKAVKANTSLTPEAKKAQLKAIRKAANDQIMQVLTPEQQKTWKKIHKKGKRGGKGGSWMDRLGLTADQKAKIKAILAASKTEIKAVRSDTTLPKEAQKAKIKQIRAAALAKVREVLTAEQQVKLDAARADKKAGTKANKKAK